ncbi:uncharacterized protein BX663DRAFT_493414 [Cokeromyces recurvatus]|uniref:uncharacterized protein n=1 Tax=Cokeromyces recurvatus TaxID=90255 RepID=UPI00222005A3|nr:uncharacterized protein BX663DRAFT_493414 [Cokeromyces recurvatus]KAI7908214.1 hypothetical protein BX663DRAFT_493414 [Cokeromyces recurvatus]
MKTAALVLSLFYSFFFIMNATPFLSTIKDKKGILLKQKREDSRNRSQDAQLGGALRGFVIPNIGQVVPSNLLGGNPPDED